jgi:hypothetical protein
MPKRKPTRSEQDARIRKAVATMIERAPEVAALIEIREIAFEGASSPLASISIRCDYEGAEALASAVTMKAAKDLLNE